jgi:hypothetical protein
MGASPAFSFALSPASRLDSSSTLAADVAPAISIPSCDGPSLAWVACFDPLGGLALGPQLVRAALPSLEGALPRCGVGPGSTAISDEGFLPGRGSYIHGRVFSPRLALPFGGP